MVALVSAVALPASTASAAGQALRGTVVDRETGRSVPTAAVAVLEGGDRLVYAGYADSAGAFHIDLPGAGTYRVEVGQLGYVPAILRGLDVEESRQVRLRVELPPSPIRIQGVEALGRSRGLERRRRRVTRGSHLSRSEIEALGPGADVVTVLRAVRAPGIRVFRFQPTPGSPSWAICVEATRLRSPAMEQRCRSVAVYVDGVRLGEPTESLGMLHPGEIERIEYIPGSVAGARWGTGSQNGVLLIETTKSRP